MTVRKFGRRWWLAAWPMAMAAAGSHAPATAQQTETPASNPAPSPIFRLPPADDGRAPGVQGPSDNGLPPVSPGERRGQPTPAPQPSAPRVVPTEPAPAPASPAPATTSTPREAAPRRIEPAVQPSAGSVAETPPAASLSPNDPAPATLAPVDRSPAGAEPATADVAPPATAAQGRSGTPLWAWLLAGLAAVGAGFWYWRRRPVLAGHAPDETAVTPEPVAAPKPAPRAASPAPSQAAVPIPAVRSPVPPPREASPLVTRPAPEQRALVALALDVRGIQILADRIEVAFTLSLTNQGPIAASGLMIRIALNQGSAMPEAVLARFFDGAGGSVMRDDMSLLPGASEQFSTEVALPRAGVEPLMIGGKPMLVPVLAFDVTYHWDGPGDAFGQNAASFLLGRAPAAGGGDKLAPLPLERATLIVDRPGARATAVRRQQ